MIFYEEIFKAFQKQKVKYVIVGGLAVNLLGSMRSTADLDILVEMSEGNLRKIVKILKRYGYRLKQPIDPIKLTDKEIRRDLIKDKHLKALNFYKKDELKEVDVIIDSPVSFKEARESCIRIKVDKLILPVISIDNLIKMKKRIGRAIDKLDIEELKNIKRLKDTI